MTLEKSFSDIVELVYSVEEMDAMTKWVTIKDFIAREVIVEP